MDENGGTSMGEYQPTNFPPRTREEWIASFGMFLIVCAFGAIAEGLWQAALWLLKLFSR